ncbi:hypothetical protein P43SY_002435 [Pythium insidiosum]|uniref:ABC transporter domain-containing protein n=1 Tax=Pythium insidiosum TaxID=114742 RepID=A0AAD5M3Z8_PYTIN|nr:hypothetical protein P43SY_002435 [Pythium insidiosum]
MADSLSVSPQPNDQLMTDATQAPPTERRGQDRPAGPVGSKFRFERQPEHNSKHQQLVSGVNLVAFWLANYVWDLLIYCIPGGVALILIQAYDLAALTGSSECLGCASNTFTAVVVLFVLFGFAICPYAYCWSFVFREHASAQTKMILINFLVGLGFLIVSFVLDVIDNNTATDVNRVLKWLYRLSPIYCLCNGYEIIFLVIDAILYLVLAVVIDYALTFPKAKAMITADPQIEVAKETEDEDVAAEAERVACGGADQDVIRLERLRKVYKDGQKIAVKNLSFGLKRGECFGFLGINGAGKTTTMKMLTGDISSLCIREYSVSQTTLEQIFNAFASQQKVGQVIPSTPTDEAGPHF